jgi:hypothetical protein
VRVVCVVESERVVSEGPFLEKSWALLCVSRREASLRQEEASDADQRSASPPAGGIRCSPGHGFLDTL